MSKRARKKAGRTGVRNDAGPGRAALGRVPVAVWAATVLVASLLPYLLLWARADAVEAGSVYTWITPPYPEDGLAYLAWIKQAAEGALLFQVKFTQLEHSAALFQPVFLVVGWLSALTGWDAGPSWFVAHFFVLLGFLFVLYRFTGAFDLAATERWVSLWMIVCSSGFGVAFGSEWQRSADLWMPELTTLWSLIWNPLFVIALTLMLLVFLLIVRAEAGRSDRAFAAAGLLTGLLAFVHSYDVIPTAVVVLAFTAHRYRRALVRPLLIYGAVALPACLLQWGVSALHPVLSAHGGSGKMLSPSLASYAVGLGLPALLAVYGAARGASELRLGRLALLWMWIFAAVGLAYSPLWFQRKLIMGIHIPVCVLAAIGLADLARRLAGERCLARAAIVVAVLLATTPTHLYNAGKMSRQVSSDPSAYYVPPAIDAALRYLDHHVPSDAVVLAHYETARLIPGFSGNTVTLGHWAQSVDDDEHVRWLSSLFDPRSSLPAAEKQAALRASRIAYVVVDPAMLSDWLRGSVPTWLSSVGETVYSESGVVIIRVDRSRG